MTVSILSSCGGGSFEKKYHVITAIIDGNTIEVDRGVQIDLIGIQNTKESKAYLEHKLLQQRVRIVYDTRHRRKITNRRDKAPAYVVTLNKLALNGEILKKGLSGIDKTYLNDSLQIFMSYTGSVYPPKTTPPKTTPPRTTPPKTTPPGTTPPGTISIGLTEIIKQVKPAVFIIYNSRYGNQHSQGTGFFITDYGLAVSNYHVVEGSQELQIKTSNEEWYFIDEIISANQEQDYAIFNVVNITNDFSYLKLNENPPDQGEEIFVLGNPQGLEGTVTRGIVSAVRNTGQFKDFIQIDAAISPGSSGSPVLNRKGEVVGMATSTISEDCQNCNFALKARIIKRAMEKIDF